MSHDACDPPPDARAARATPDLGTAPSRRRPALSHRSGPGVAAGADPGIGAVTDTAPRLAALAPPSAARQTAGPSPAQPRFVDLEEVASGGSARLFHAFDSQLHVPVALKAMHPDTPGARERLGQLPVEMVVAHPAVVPLLARWRTDDGWIWLAMRWIEGGGTLLHVIGRLHDSNRWSEPTVRRPGAAPTPSSGRVDPCLDWVDGAAALMLLADAARAVGEAHAAGHVHLDLKPDNVMFQMARVSSASPMRAQWRFWQASDHDMTPGEPPPALPRARIIDWGLSLGANAAESRSGDVPGVAQYMAPERLRGEAGATAPTSDVYALGAILFELLTGQPPHGMDRGRVRRMVLEGAPLHLPQPVVGAGFAGLDVEPYLDLCLRALDPDPARRPADATAFAVGLSRARGRALYRRTQVLHRESVAARRRAADRLAQARAALALLDERAYEDLDARCVQWSRIDRAGEDDALADIREAQRIRRLRDILAVDHRFVEVALELIEWRCGRVQTLRRGGDRRGVRLALEALDADLRAFDDTHPGYGSPVLRRARAVLGGRGFLRLAVPDGCTVELARQRLLDRRLQAHETDFGRPDGDLRAPLELPAGRWLLRVSQPGHHGAIVPAHITAGATWPPPADLPDAAEPPPCTALPLRLPLAGTLGDDDVYIAGGPAWLCGAKAIDSPARGRWVDVPGFVVKRDPVTHGAWCAFLDDLHRRGDDAEPWRPRPGGGRPGHPDCVLIDDRHRLTFDGAPAPDMARLPVQGISWFAAMAYAAWFDAACVARGEPGGWRLCSEWEYEKLARMGDDRALHWGDHAEPRFTRIAGSTVAQYQPAPIDAPTFDVTPHGVRWVAGNAQIWCLDPWSFAGPWGQLDPAAILREARAARSDTTPDGVARARVIRGASYTIARGQMSGAARFAVPPNKCPVGVGLRLVRTWPPLDTRSTHSTPSGETPCPPSSAAETIRASSNGRAIPSSAGAWPAG